MWRLASQEFNKYAKDDDEDYNDVFGKPNGSYAAAQHLVVKLGDKDTDEEDPFAEIDEGYAEDDLEANLQRDKHAQLTTAVNQLIDELTPSAPDSLGHL
ncbi:hypothetical protein BJV77DRAFT_1071934 [Russula vinacea]|nr:hypothetical protein BJV77DRAFT_1071934 [Russula vinacea]